ncbi:iron uptake transporter permease EfeU [Rhodococcus tukisamuensis]|uniref:High-affinity iron transporter n=1 Tax=Rhodococcus tukisamuensis TaxID=168276 RepID=A0A1G7APC0_9NOCA|nr:iron uptake transporter permease EfeU [Rhodococcus tukisamuensis]SDE16550.1 high-affinity iron transporter [Rhodococcus tukisamuensis]
MHVLAAGGTPGIATQLFGSGLIGVREGLETGIVVMILVAFLVKSDRRDALKWVWVGVGAAVAMVVILFGAIHFGTSTVTGTAAELISGIASLVAVVIVTAMVLWMRKAAASISGHLKADLARALAVGPFAVAAMAFFAVGREGVETALLLVGYAENSAGSTWPLVGLLLGIAVAALLTVLLYVGAVRINFTKFFRYTGVFLIVVAAGILAYGVRALQIAGWLPGRSTLAFDVSAGFDTSSWYAVALQGIFNLRPDPTLLQVLAWATYVVVVLALFLRPLAPKPAAPAPAGDDKTSELPV